MTEGDKHKFDELFKHGLDAPEDHFDFDEADWDSMESLLPGENKPVKVFPFGTVAAIAATVLIALAFGWWMVSPIDSGEKQRAQIENKAFKNDSIVAGQRKHVAQSVDIAGKIPAGQSVIVQGKAKVIKRDVTAKQPGLIAVTQHSRRRSSKTAAVGNAPFASLIGPDSGTIKHGDRTMAQSPATSLKDTVVVIASAAMNTAVTGADDRINTDAKVNDAVTVNNAKVKGQVNSSSVSMAISAILSPNFNGVGSLRDSKMGKTAGLMFLVGVSDKMMISTGAVYSQVPYATAYSNYISTYSFYTKPTNVMADCRILDIPLMVDYQVYHQGKNSFNIGAGLSSYFMLKETYDYQFASSYTSGPSSFSVSNKNTHLFGVLDLSTTYQRKLNNKFSIGLQPYLKLPLTDIGNNRVKLQTAGIALSASWTIINKKP